MTIADPNSENLPLLDLFTQLREAGFPLGIGEYRLALRALQLGFGAANLSALSATCKTLWVKSEEDEHLFNYHFEKVVGDRFSERPSETENPSKPEAVTESEEPIPATPKAKEFNELIAVEDEMQIAEAVRVNDRVREALGDREFPSTDEYFPVTRRQMKNSWRYLRRALREGPATDVDIEATVAQIADRGIMLEPVLLPSRANQTELLLLVDRKGSMVPFQALADRLVETARRGGGFKQVAVYYFHNCPGKYLYRDSARSRAVAIEAVLAELKPEHTVAVVFSDAGAARGGLNFDRLEQTQHFLERLDRRVRRIAWLNPVPRSRWLGTTAGEIAELVPGSFECDRQGLKEAIASLKGRREISIRRLE